MRYHVVAVVGTVTLVLACWWAARCYSDDCVPSLSPSSEHVVGPEDGASSSVGVPVSSPRRQNDTLASVVASAVHSSSSSARASVLLPVSSPPSPSASRTCSPSVSSTATASSSPSISPRGENDTVPVTAELLQFMARNFTNVNYTRVILERLASYMYGSTGHAACQRLQRQTTAMHSSGCQMVFFQMYHSEEGWARLERHKCVLGLRLGGPIRSPDDFDVADYVPELGNGTMGQMMMSEYAGVIAFGVASVACVADEINWVGTASHKMKWKSRPLPCDMMQAFPYTQHLNHTRPPAFFWGPSVPDAHDTVAIFVNTHLKMHVMLTSFWRDVFGVPEKVYPMHELLKVHPQPWMTYIILSKAEMMRLAKFHIVHLAWVMAKYGEWTTPSPCQSRDEYEYSYNRCLAFIQEAQTLPWLTIATQLLYVDDSMCNNAEVKNDFATRMSLTYLVNTTETLFDMMMAQINA